MVREFFSSDVEGIERVGAVGTVFEQVFFLRCTTKATSRLRGPPTKYDSHAFLYHHLTANEVSPEVYALCYKT